jgi:hypothetical protein
LAAASQADISVGEKESGNPGNLSIAVMTVDSIPGKVRANVLFRHAT